MFNFKALIIGFIIVALGTGVTYLSYKAEQEEFREEFELNKFNEKWNSGDDSQRLDLLEEELKKLCNANPNGCRTDQEMKDMVNKKPDLKRILEEKFTNFSGTNNSFSDICRQTIKQMKIKAFCPT
ncbi:hypothetical protein A6V39_04950 [Candidatus Mycoplasma haematobovis]|uniref:Uncharacterized protein n=1 Tax=Candidatus Mycoplasma haematobovis TaxID=432608 RepID=A0A1A9QCT9_9MOLU|nr:hypothetical protein [Candidatus Mycoplasma haematobovis]OAL09775.1 hypothetical protein A6V39_04950 [Candidatus Mycoplasma haematobovis]